LKTKHGSFDFVHDLIRYRFIESVEDDVECDHFLVYKSKKNYILVDVRGSVSLDGIQEWIAEGGDMRLFFNFSDGVGAIRVNVHDVFDRKPIAIDWITRIKRLEYLLDKEKYEVDQKINFKKLKILRKRQREHGNTFEFVAHYYKLLRAPK
jgi:hypothetical protein